MGSSLWADIHTPSPTITHLLRENKCNLRATMSSPAKDLPKIADQLKGEILAERSLKPTEAQEKNVLPSADDVKQEKNHQNIMTGITGFKSDSLKPTETVEKVVLPGKEEIKTEKTI